MTFYISPSYHHDKVIEFKRRVKENKFFPVKHLTPPRMDWTDNVYYWIGNTCENICFGMVRGWDEKWDDKCLGIITAPQYQGQGYGSLMLRVLEQAARLKGERRMRLHVNSDNEKAIAFYEKNGYKFSGEKREDGELIGFKDLYYR